MSIDADLLNLTKTIVNDYEAKLNSVIDLCESEIEKLFLLSILNFFIRYPLGVSFLFSKDAEIYGVIVYEDSDYIITIVPQKVIKVKRTSYRVDFFISVKMDEKKARVCIECDGFEFHGLVRSFRANSKFF